MKVLVSVALRAPLPGQASPTLGTSDSVTCVGFFLLVFIMSISIDVNILNKGLWGAGMI